MTERTRGSQPSGSPQEAIDLNELHASKTHEQLRADVFASTNTDLASASIQSINVVRLSARPEKRKLTHLSPGTSLDPFEQHEPKTGTKPTVRSNHKHGIFKNPYFPYEGGPLGRLISLIANLMKVVELAVFNPGKQAALTPPTPSVTLKRKKRDAHGREIDEENDDVTQQQTPPIVPEEQ